MMIGGLGHTDTSGATDLSRCPNLIFFVLFYSNKEQVTARGFSFPFDNLTRFVHS